MIYCASKLPETMYICGRPATFAAYHGEDWASGEGSCTEHLGAVCTEMLKTAPPDAGERLTVLPVEPQLMVLPGGQNEGSVG